MESFLYLLYPKDTIKSEYYKKIVNNSSKVFGSVAYHMDWTFIFEQIDKWKLENDNRIATILDVGCGNSTFHTFLEEYYKHGIIGIDRTDSTKAYNKFRQSGHKMVNAVDLCIDFIKTGNNYFNENVDIVFWNSAIEHNEIDKINKAIEVSLQCLRKGGLFISTWALGEKTFWHEGAKATILSKYDAEKVFELKWANEVNFNEVRRQYIDNYLKLKEWHLNRFGHLNINYFHSGSVIIK